MHAGSQKEVGDQWRGVVAGVVVNFLGKAMSLMGSHIDKADAEVTKLNLETEFTSEANYKELRKAVEYGELSARKAEIDARLRKAQAELAKADAEKRRAERSWRNPDKPFASGRGAEAGGGSVTGSLKEGTTRVESLNTKDVVLVRRQANP